MKKEQNKCRCIIKHAITADERKAAMDRLEVARQLSDTTGIILSLSMLTGNCPARAPGK